MCETLDLKCENCIQSFLEFSMVSKKKKPQLKRPHNKNESFNYLNWILWVLVSYSFHICFYYELVWHKLGEDKTRQCNELLCINHVREFVDCCFADSIARTFRRWRYKFWIMSVDKVCALLKLVIISNFCVAVDVIIGAIFVFTILLNNKARKSKVKRIPEISCNS